MSTQPQIIANRLNAQKSTGPQTPQGKAVVSQNALKHGLSARHDVITTESQADFDLHRDALLAELAPESPMESMLTDRIVSLSWRLRRADVIQNQTIDAMNEETTTNPLANLAKSFGLKGLGFPQPEPTDSHPDLTLGRIALKDFSNARVLDRLLMYERRIEHSLYKTTLELQRLRLLRNLEHPNATNVAPAVPPFSRRRHACPERSRRDDALTPNSTPHDGIPIHQEPISQIRRGGINNQSSIVNIEKPPEPAQNHPTSTILERSGDPLGGVSRIEHHCAKQTQFQNGQYKHKYSNSKGLCQRTTNNQQRTLSKTNPIKPNSPTEKDLHSGPFGLASCTS